MLKQLFHIALAFYLLAITAGVAINKHYCGGEVVSFSVYLKAHGCSDMDETWEKSCCKDVSTFFQLDDDFTSKSTSEFISTIDFQFLIPEYTFLASLFLPESIYKKHIQIAYSPPPIISDIQVEAQSFLL